MTLARTALRLAAVNALLDKTIAEERIFDSRIPALDMLNPDERKPIVMVTTDGDQGAALSDQNGGRPYRRTIDLICEITMATVEKDGPDFVVGVPETDDELEASLDLLEGQIWQALWDDLGAAGALFRKVALRSPRYESGRYKSDDSTVKLASRVVTIACEVKDDGPSSVYRAGVDTPPTGFDALPESLRTVAEGLPDGSYGKAICASLADAVSPITAPALVGTDPEVAPNAEDPQSPTVLVTIDLPQA